ncbi:hypothetical protein GGU10DRAFT_425661 [Lentinula aff. detonsa]|uniref:DUF1996 domain-containing protein n=1 Tax=Lentinula aff. detonsa TaxID=2804958 RepID=A0AA38NQR6_9AGAR|nr:hypothetical protein GGU10DRAFT_425661 [Lentinula aff. detonsa]
MTLLSTVICQMLVLTQSFGVNAYWLMASNNVLTTQRMDPIVSPGEVSSHVHSVLGGSGFDLNVNTSILQGSECTSIPVQEDKSNYWFPQLYFQRNDGSFTSVSGNAVMYYLFSDTSNSTTAFPNNFRMLSGDTTLRTLNASSFAQQAITFLCLQFSGTSNRYNELPIGVSCPAGIRSQINFPSCWDGKNIDSEDHKTHVAFLSTGPDNGTCDDPQFPVTLPRIFMEVYWITQDFDDQRDQALTPSQPFVFANGDPTGYGYHADFVNGWEDGVLQKAISGCTCNPYGDPTCCVDAGIFSFNQTKQCYISDTIDEPVLGNLSTLPGANPVQAPCFESYIATSTPPILAPVYTFTATASTHLPSGTVVTPAHTTQEAQTVVGTCIWRGAALRNWDASICLRVAVALVHMLWFLF